MQKNFEKRLQNLNNSVQDLWDHAYHDSLTRLPNRTALEDVLLSHLNGMERGKERSLAVLYMDLNGFKKVNDTLGHEAGDEVLKQVADRLGQQHREDAFRHGGDEFVVVIHNPADAAQAMETAQSTRKALSGTYTLGEHKAHVSASIGVVYRDADARLLKQGEEAVREILNLGDKAMYRAKKLSKASLLVQGRASDGRCLLHEPRMLPLFEHPEYKAPLRNGYGRGRLILKEDVIQVAFRFVQYCDGELLFSCRHEDEKSLRDPLKYLRSKYLFEGLVEVPESNLKCSIKPASEVELSHQRIIASESEDAVESLRVHSPQLAA